MCWNSKTQIKIFRIENVIMFIKHRNVSILVNWFPSKYKYASKFRIDEYICWRTHQLQLVYEKNSLISDNGFKAYWFLMQFFSNWKARNVYFCLWRLIVCTLILTTKLLCLWENGLRKVFIQKREVVFYTASSFVFLLFRESMESNKN